MALRTKLGADLPEGAVAVSREEALKYQWALIKKWPSEAEVLSIKFGREITAATTMGSSYYLISVLRKFLLVSPTRFALAVTPGVFLPAYFSYHFTNGVITNEILLMKLTCPICTQIKFACMQFYLGVIFPALYGYLSLTGSASAAGNFPRLLTHPKEFKIMSYSLLKQVIPYTKMMGLVHTVLVLGLPYIQSKQFDNILRKCEEKELENASEELLPPL